MNIDKFLSEQAELVKSLLMDKNSTFRELDYYENIENNDLKYVFAGLQHELNRLFSFMNDKSNGVGIGHFNADPSRDLIQVIDIYNDLKHFLKGTSYEFSLDTDYEAHIKKSETFLSKSNGSDIPQNYKKIRINKYTAIFTPVDAVSIKNNGNEHLEPLKMLGEGSYAIVYKYKDTFYDCWFAVKRLKKGSRDDEIQRFRKKFQILKKLHSPYILNVFEYDEEKQQYVMEMADFTLLDYLAKHPNLAKKTRLSIAHQVLAGFKYLHSKDLLHRDVAFNNILIFDYDDTLVVKISDLGLVKMPESNLTQTKTEIKGSLADPFLTEDGFKNYKLRNEIYSMTRLLYFIMTNKQTLGGYPNKSVEFFVLQGTNSNKALRYISDDEILKAFNETQW